MSNVHYLQVTAPVISLPKKLKDREHDVNAHRGAAISAINKQVKASGDRVLGVFAMSDTGALKLLEKAKNLHMYKGLVDGVRFLVSLVAYVGVVGFLDVSSWIGIAALTLAAILMGNAVKALWCVYRSYGLAVLDALAKASDLWVMTSQRLYVSRGDLRPFLEAFDYDDFMQMDLIVKDGLVDIDAFATKPISLFGVSQDFEETLQNLQSQAKNAETSVWKMG